MPFFLFNFHDSINSAIVVKRRNGGRKYGEYDRKKRNDWKCWMAICVFMAESGTGGKRKVERVRDVGTVRKG